LEYIESGNEKMAQDLRIETEAAEVLSSLSQAFGRVLLAEAGCTARARASQQITVADVMKSLQTAASEVIRQSSVRAEHTGDGDDTRRVA